jgi:hypothetical protein
MKEGRKLVETVEICRDLFTFGILLDANRDKMP